MSIRHGSHRRTLCGRSNDNMRNVVEAVTSGEMTANKASRVSEVQPTTLKGRLGMGKFSKRSLAQLKIVFCKNSSAGELTSTVELSHSIESSCHNSPMSSPGEPQDRPPSYDNL